MIRSVPGPYSVLHQYLVHGSASCMDSLRQTLGMHVVAWTMRTAFDIFPHRLICTASGFTTSVKQRKCYYPAL